AGVSLPGVSVRTQSTNRGTATDEDGLFSIAVDPNDVLIFSYVGFVSQEIKYTNQSALNIALVAENTAMDEVVVVGYGTQKKVSMTGSVASVKIDEKITNRAVSNMSSALSGLMPGLAVNQNSGMAGQNSGIM